MGLVIHSRSYFSLAFSCGQHLWFGSERLTLFGKEKWLFYKCPWFNIFKHWSNVQHHSSFKVANGRRILFWQNVRFGELCVEGLIFSLVQGLLNLVFAPFLLIWMVLHPLGTLKPIEALKTWRTRSILLSIYDKCG